MFYTDSQGVYRVRELDAHSWLDLGFGTRLSGLWPRPPVLALHQIHSNHCVWVPSPPWPAPEARGSILGEGDALLCDRAGVHVSVRTADCIPVLVADLQRRVVAAVHAGWRGTAGGIVSSAVLELMRKGSEPEHLVAAIGPGICGRCYTVGAEVAAQFRRWFPEREDLDGQTQLDLVEANRRQLLAAGVESVYTGAPCTFCGGTELYSYRREGARAGRMFAAVGVI